MQSKILILRFPAESSQKPLVCNLARNFELTFNILHAQILPRREGLMVLELSGNRESFRQGLAYLEGEGIDVQNAGQEITRDESRCTHCGACTAVCPTGALHVLRPTMEVAFDQEKCSICEICILTCPTRAMCIKATKTEKFFE
ncbi:4Fe-4S binding protein [Desulfobotulus sp. H1]|uniref:4Fe-4S binding protein n=1 Tax=Desulfobotulus pelophilus TaxID=2823377 RepID=A0ABT3N9Z5_9BACT|nr:NIL domain-containing protein [Desulfobotulus pelophilus]MCW7754283.1 4Fe-4S binding protein [Desulfobotulus pelophilus]